MGGLFGGSPDTSGAERAAAETKAETAKIRTEAEDEKRERLQYARAFENLPPAARARIQDKLKGK